MYTQLSILAKHMDLIVCYLYNGKEQHKRPLQTSQTASSCYQNNGIWWATLKSLIMKTRQSCKMKIIQQSREMVGQDFSGNTVSTIQLQGHATA